MGRETTIKQNLAVATIAICCNFLELLTRQQQKSVCNNIISQVDHIDLPLYLA